MSVDVSAELCLGWFVEHDELTDRFYEMMDGDFEELDGKFDSFGIGYKYGYDMVTQVNGYSDDSAWHIGIGIDIRRKVVVDGKVDYEDMGIVDFADNCRDMAALVPDLERLYESIMGVKPPCKPYVSLFERWW